MLHALQTCHKTSLVNNVHQSALHTSLRFTPCCSAPSSSLKVWSLASVFKLTLLLHNMSNNSNKMHAQDQCKPDYMVMVAFAVAELIEGCQTGSQN